MDSAGVAGVKDERSVGQLAHLEGKYLTFALGEEIYGFNILRVSEIIGVIPITPVPRTPSFVRGVINLRGKIIPVIDLRLKFGMEGRNYDRGTCVVVTEVAREDRHLSIGMVVDTVVAVHDFTRANISAVPEYGTTIDTHCIQGVGTVSSGEVIILIDVEQVIGDGRFGVSG